VVSPGLNARNPHKFLTVFTLADRCFLCQIVFVFARKGDSKCDVGCFCTFERRDVCSWGWPDRQDTHHSPELIRYGPRHRGLRQVSRELNDAVKRSPLFSSRKAMFDEPSRRLSWLFGHWSRWQPGLTGRWKRQHPTGRSCWTVPIGRLIQCVPPKPKRWLICRRTVRRRRSNSRKSRRTSSSGFAGLVRRIRRIPLSAVCRRFGGWTRECSGCVRSYAR